MRTYLPTVLATALVACVSATAAQAQATRTWVSGVGDDANPCSRTAPCKTFAGAISKTAAAGEINCLDPGGFGAVTIVKSITIDCTGTFGSILASGTSGVIINAAGIIVTLRGISINGASTTAGSGVRILNASAVNIDDVVIANFTGTGTVGRGVSIETAAGTVEVTVQNSKLFNMGTGGVVARLTGAGAARVVVDKSSIHNCATGILIDGAGSTGGINATVRETAISGMTGHGVQSTSPAGGAPIIAMLDRIVAVYNNTGVSSTGAGGSQVRIGGSVVTGNALGVTISGGSAMRSYKTNQIVNNTVDGTPLTALALE